MNDDTELDELIGSALSARASQLTEADLTPGRAPVGPGRPTLRSRWTVPLLAAAVTVLVAGSTVLVQSLASTHPRRAVPVASAPEPTGSAPGRPASPGHSQASSSSAGSRSMTASASSRSAPASASSPAGAGFVLGYQPLWPFDSYRQASDWLAGYRSQGSQPWHRDPALTAVSFTRDYLGFTGLNSTTSSRTDSTGAHIGVGYLDPNGTLHTAAVLHLVRYGSSADSPWEVVGSDDTTFSLETPAYGSTVGSPVTVGGHLTGVDESIRLAVRSLSRGLVSAPVAPIPAGGDHQPWQASITFTPGGTLTIVAATGGHLQAVERFAIQGVLS